MYEDAFEAWLFAKGDVLVISCTEGITACKITKVGTRFQVTPCVNLGASLSHCFGEPFSFLGLRVGDEVACPGDTLAVIEDANDWRHISCDRMGGGSVNLWYVSEGLGLQVVAGHRVEGNFCLVSLTQELVITLSSLDLVQVWSGVSRGQAVCIASLPTTGGVQAMIESDIYNTACRTPGGCPTWMSGLDSAGPAASAGRAEQPQQARICLPT